MPLQFAFISVGDPGKTSDSDRQLIRSHVMRDKNKRLGSRRSVREAKIHAARYTDGPRIDVGLVSNSQLIDSAIQHSDETKDVLSKEKPREEVVEACMRIERQIREGTGVFASMDGGEVRPTELVAEFLKFDKFKDASFPLKERLEFEADEMVYIPWLFEDTAYAHSVFLSTSALNDFRLGRPFSRSTLFHLRSTLDCLNKKLKDDPGYLGDSTTYTIISLAMLATLVGDLPALRAHMVGMQRILQLRGGEEWLRQRPKQSFMLNSLDLASSVDSGCFPYFSLEPTHWQSAFTGPPLACDMTSVFVSVIGLVDARLATVFYDLQRLARMSNAHAQRNTKLKGDVYQHVIGSIQRRLLWLRYPCEQVWSECMRLGMLAFLTTSFRMPGRKVSFKHLAASFRASCGVLRMSVITSETQGLTSWLLLVGAMSVFHPREPWLLATWKTFAVPGDTWDDVRRQQESVAWINDVHDEPGKRAYIALTT